MDYFSAIEILNVIALVIVGALFTIPQIWGLVLTFSILGHLSQFLVKKVKKEETK